MLNTIKFLLAKNKELIYDPEIKLVVLRLDDEFGLNAAVIAADFKWYHGQKRPEWIKLHTEKIWWPYEYHTEPEDQCMERTQKILDDNQEFYQQKAQEVVSKFIARRQRWKNKYFRKT